MIESLIYIIVLIYSIILHEIAHGYVAYREGDSTAKWAGRLTLWPWPHIDILGSIIVPILSYLSAGVTMGWAKGVPYNPHMLRHRYSEARVAAAGVAMNFSIAVVFAIVYKVCNYNTLSQGFSFNFIEVIKYASTIIVIVNVSLGIFNLLPLPPFDGMRILTSVFPHWGQKMIRIIDANQTVFLVASLYIAYHIWPFISPAMYFIIDLLL